MIASLLEKSPSLKTAKVGHPKSTSAQDIFAVMTMNLSAWYTGMGAEVGKILARKNDVWGTPAGRCLGEVLGD